MKDIIIEELTRLLIKQDLEDKKKGKVTYVKKVSCYKDLIEFFKQFDVLKENGGFDIVIGNPPYVNIENIAVRICILHHEVVELIDLVI